MAGGPLRDRRERQRGVLALRRAHRPRSARADGSQRHSVLTPGCGEGGYARQFSGFTEEPPASAQIITVPSALIISKRSASGSSVFSRPVYLQERRATIKRMPARE
jgi:hypothetical protein